MIAGSARSAGVIERTMASTRPTSPSSIWSAAWRSSLDMPGISFMMPAQRPELPDLLELLQEVLEGEAALHHPRAADLATTSWSIGPLGLLDQAEHVAHAEDAVGHAVGVEEVEVGEPLAGGGEDDRPADHLLDREGGAAAGVAVELGEDDPVERQRLVEGAWPWPPRPGRSWRR